MAHNFESHEAFTVRVHPSLSPLPKEEQLAWRLAALACDPAPLALEVTQMVCNRIIDNAGVAIAALNRHPVQTARAMALAHPRKAGASLFGVDPSIRVDAEWAAWANGTAVRELDFHDTFLAADYAHPADTIPPLMAVAQQMGKDGAALLRAIVVAYEIHISLVRAICLHRHKIDHIAHLAPAVAGGIAALLALPVETAYQAIQQAVHVCCTTRQSRKGEISSWKAFAPAHAGKLAIEAVDRAMRGEGAPSPIYEGEDSIIAWLLDGPQAEYRLYLPAPSMPKRAILDSYTKAHSAEYQAQALIDLAIALRAELPLDLSLIRSIVIETSHHTHFVIGSGACDPQKSDPKASRETLDHSILYIFAVALEDGAWHHLHSYTPERASRPSTIALWHKITTREDPVWTARYHSADPAQKGFGGRAIITLQDGQVISRERALADAHPQGARPFTRGDYIKKFHSLTQEWLSHGAGEEFLTLAQALPDLNPAELQRLNPAIDPLRLVNNPRPGIF
jgi:2-methylcitrate dehydratase